ncbi:N-acetylmuramoyl-L-alanine amidase [Cronbergia sp. UHCC 0137]|uniref:N-acetylmuramoyl-L-alanine amidase n=1 Tax=Cronbergia sp. UHCC 0137 TaxID=3110239 RepID=UPI002B1FAF34|nr:N-acetylmuramoyl-L-alanine amidase [Cronbergia sp. UHCC 0137]MEA5617172.1 N-acetylmuramoyl-L-alanine amidase [Cronbergia sp. UHCC 0137]
MKKLLVSVVLTYFFSSSVAYAQSSLVVVFPPINYQTSTEKIFFIGTAPSDEQVIINGNPVKRHKIGHFSPSVPLKLGENTFTIRHPNEEGEIKVIRRSLDPELSQGVAFAKDSLTPSVDLARLPGELICFGAIARPNAIVSVKLNNRTIALLSQPAQAQLPANISVLTGKNAPITANFSNYQGCTTFTNPGDLGQPQFNLTLNGQTITQSSPGKVQILTPEQLPVVEVTVPSGVARTGASTDYSRLTPLPQGTRLTVTGKDGDWLRLDYGAWINSQETQTLPGTIPPQTIIRSVASRQVPGAVEIRFPLQVPVPVSVQQGDNYFTLSLYNTTAQTDTIRLDDNPLISRLDWQQVTPTQVNYTFNLKKLQQWGYKLKYENTTLVLTLRQPPMMGNNRRKPLSNIKILLNPGHGGKEFGSRGGRGYLAKDVNLALSKLLRDELVKRGATVVMTREDDRDVSLVERQEIINREEPAIALSIHYNFLPDDGNTEKIRGLMSFWYHPQAHSPAIFLHNYLVNKHREPSYGVFWNNLALTRPSTAPAVLLEFRLMSNVDEFEELVNPEQQKKIARTLADGVTEWFKIVK